MADETIAISIDVNVADSAKSVGDLKKSIKDLKNAALEAEAQGNKTLADAYVKAAGKATDKLGDLNKQVQNLSSDTKKLDGAIGVIQGLAGGFAAAQGAAALFGGSGKELEKTMLKVQAATALATGVQQIANTVQKESAASMFVLSTATAAYNTVVGTTTGALKVFRLALAATGVGAIALAVYELYENFDKVKKVLANIIPESVQKAFTFLKDSIGSLYDKTKQFLGLGEEAKSKNPFGILDQFTQKAGENKKALSDLIAKQKEQAEYLKKLNEAGEPGSIGYYNFLLSQSNAELNKLIPGTAEYNNELRTQIQLQEKVNALQEQQKILQGTPEELKKKGTDTLDISKNPEVTQLKKIEMMKTKVVVDESAKRDFVAKKESENRKLYAKAVLQSSQSVLNGIAAIGDIFIKNEKKKEAFQKKVAATQLLIDTASGISSVVREASKVGFPAAIPIIAGGVAMVLGNIAKAKALLSKAGDTSTPSLDVGGVAGGGTNAGAEQTIPSLNQQTTQLNGGQNMPKTQVYVTETDIKRVGTRVGVIEARARFG